MIIANEHTTVPDCKAEDNLPFIPTGGGGSSETPETIKEKYESNQSVIDRLARLENTSGENTGDQDLSDYLLIENLPTSLPASDVYAWAKEETKPTYTKTEIGLSNVSNPTQWGGILSENLNNIIYSGFYTCYTGTAGLSEEMNALNLSFHILHVNSNVGINGRYQIARAFNTSVISYERAMVGGVWGNWKNVNTDPIPLYCSDMKTDITASNIEPKIRFTFEEARTLTGVVGSLSVASVGGVFTVDIKKNGTSIFSTLLTFDSGENTTRTASVPYVLTENVSFAIGDYVDVFVTIAGSTTAGKGLLITLLTTK